ncbi:MAG: diguanylate cyclase [Pseudomonadales bacterium]|nr:diguanylate cyclase [Pseudomonadales bacterium]
MPTKAPAKKTCMLCVVMRLWLASLLVLYLLSDQVFASEVNLAESTDFFFDVENQYTIDDVVAMPKSMLWQSNSRNTLHLGFSESTLWLRIRINETFAQSPGLVEIAWPFLDRVEAFWVENENARQQISSLGVQGDHVPRNAHFLEHRYFIFPLPGDNKYDGTLYLKINSSSSLILPIWLRDPQGFYKKETGYQIFLGFFFGVLAIILIYNAGMWFYIRDRIYLYYVGYSAFLCIYIGSLTGLGTQYIWGNSPGFSDVALLLGVLGSFIFGSLFVDSFLDFKKNNRFAHRAVKVAIVIYALIVLTYLFTSEAFVTPIGQSLGIVASVFAYIIGIWEWRKGNPDARYFTFAWSMLLIGTCTYTFLLAGVVPDNLFTQSIQAIGLLVEMGLLSFALGERFTRERTAAKQATEMALHLASEVNKSHEDKIKLQQEANQKLEGQVTERTKELQATLTKLEQANEQLEALSNTDQLTGLKNRRFFNKYYDDEFRRSVRHKSPISIVVLDVDHFKQVNDTYGHLAGDICLKKVADVMQFHSQRPGDIAVRFGGEEFVILLVDTDVTGAEQVSEYIRDEVEQTLVQAENHSFKVTISLGIASVIPQEDLKPEELLRRADAALYQAKANGRNRVEVA